MDKRFDPYYEWLGIPVRDHPPNWYRLLGIELFEANANVIERAADRQMGHLRTFQTGVHAKESQRLLNEVSTARVGLLSPERKSAYDEQLRAAATAAAPSFESSPPPLTEPPATAPTPPPRADSDPLPPPPPPPPAIPNPAPASQTPATTASIPIPAPLRTRRVLRRPKSFWRKPGMWGLIVLLIILVGLLGWAVMRIGGGQLPLDSFFDRKSEALRPAGGHRQMPGALALRNTGPHEEAGVWSSRLTTR